jgi:hypothetical protein
MEAARLACDTRVGLRGMAIGSPPRVFAPRSHPKGGRISDVLSFPAWGLDRGQNRTVARWT